MMKLKSGETSCKYCGNDYHFYVMYAISGRTGIFHGFNGEEVDNTHMWDAAKLKPLKTAYCGECHKSLGRVIDDE
ncbi:hypothetical protein [Providencia alcalifaciens]|uniref:hypothetical protein n=1 Tax=Providencia alcalifaciens TaxID=126385 RepID=UPI002B05E4C2|nr:hypothetical protein [Providencia alcalifaciens]